MSKRRIVVKIGSSSLTEKDGQLSPLKLNTYVKAIAELAEKEHEVILISSGAVAAGFKMIGYPARPVTVSGKQAAAAVGQNLLMKGYAEAFYEKGLITAQLLLTRQDFLQEEQYQNASNTLKELLKRKVIPIINENDSTAIEELTFGDNDMLSALVSGFLHADQLIILTDIDGIYDANPHTNPEAKKYAFLNEITDDLMEKAQGSSSKVGTGGMNSKLNAAKAALSMGVDVFIGKGNDATVLSTILQGQGNGTYLSPSKHRVMKNKKQWIAYHSTSKGKLILDEGAAHAVLKNGKSVLPVGITAIEGKFEKNDVVDVYNSGGQIIGKGKVNYRAEQLNSMINHSEKNKKETSNEAIHRDYWFSI
ncbi:glutamate 5-kinase [Salipaludibacillus daqingensis]|uniref:glutamate 5-kinase n=1 Tax=Salipaludibacillus daqingensis TaxID=3041001 RepID=UPI00247489B9|nr:glutamate 5-kinase [Salipaludibacillus daqingensis]